MKTIIDDYVKIILEHENMNFDDWVTISSLDNPEKERVRVANLIAMLGIQLAKAVKTERGE